MATSLGAPKTTLSSLTFQNLYKRIPNSHPKSLLTTTSPFRIKTLKSLSHGSRRFFSPYRPFTARAESENAAETTPTRSFDFDLFTIGAGSGGVRASRFAASYGVKVAICELPFATISSETAGGFGGT
ncbi:hypothetical protein GIB67_018145 [Kingdonia uniflora]|uniref:Glutathione reductase n=1 Tax=Kingdonia uniflora TaxID=39325 RepID=A0A7J7NM89_9MAGN|nr:hypothetical protein GIB67_018145 [Kingdonia uniflora]